MIKKETTKVEETKKFEFTLEERIGQLKAEGKTIQEIIPILQSEKMIDEGEIAALLVRFA